MTRNAFAARTPDPRLPIEKTAPDVVPAEILARGAELVVGLEAAHDERALLLGEELGRVREVLDDPERRCAGDDGDEALEDEDPCPAGLSAETPHLGDAAGEETTECTGGGGSAEEDGHAQTALVTAVPHLQRGKCMRIDKSK